MNQATKRETIAAQILAGMLSNHVPANPSDREQMISQSVRIADQLIAQVGDE